MKTILLPVDFSPRSASAAKYAAALACRSQAHLAVLHVEPRHPVYSQANDVSLPAAYALEIAWDELRQKEANERLAEFVSSHLRGVPVSQCVRTGDVAKVIVEQVHARNADLVVMATHGFGGFRRMLLGSVSAKVLHDVRCPVFTSAHVEATPAVIPPFRNILCAVDFALESEAVVRWASEFARSMGAQLFLTHVLPNIPTGQWGYCEADVSVEMRKDAEDKRDLLFEATGVDAKWIMESGTVVEKITELAKDTHADLLVIGRHHQDGILGRLRDTAYAIIRESPCPVVSV